MADGFAAYFDKTRDVQPVGEPLFFMILPMLPQALAIFAARTLGGSALCCLYAARLANLAGYAFWCWLALKNCRRYKPVFLAMMLLPLSLFMAASCSYDAMLLGCGLGARLCGFTDRESVQVGVGMVCRGEVALIVANRGLSMGVLSAAMMTPVVITVVGGTILTPILLKLVFRGETQEQFVESNLADRYEKTEQLEDAAQQLLDADSALRKKH